MENLELGVTVDGTHCGRPVAGRFALAPPRAGAHVQESKGALVRAAGFWENGTLFYTNMPEVDQASFEGKPWPRAGWYRFAGDSPLQVHVYGEDEEEIPPHWGHSSIFPFDDPLAPSPTRYATTIPGFNEALKGLSTTTMWAGRIAPEDAYTRPGFEGHRLYGQALVFLVRIEAVADHPCPAGTSSDLPHPRVDPCFRR